MKRLQARIVLVVITVLFAGASRVALGQDKVLPVAKDKWDLGPLAKLNHLRLADMKYDGDKRVMMTLEFTDNLSGLGGELFLHGGLTRKLLYFHFYKGNTALKKTNDYVALTLIGQ